MKKVVMTLALLLSVALCAQPVHATDMLGQEVRLEGNSGRGTDQGTPDTVYTATIVFDKNGGSGSMQNIAVMSNTTTQLTGNAFTRKGFTFTGWNTQADGKGVSYVDQADVTSLATLENSGQNIILYAQWKINAPKITKVAMATPVTVKVSYKKDANASGYEIQYGMKSNFKGAKSVTAKNKETNKVLTDIVPGKTYYVRMRSSVGSGSEKTYSDWCGSKKIKVKNVSNIANTKSQATIEADVTLTGSGTGYHAKLVMCTPTAAVSFGIQYDSCAVSPYTGKSMALIENIASNNAGGQQYSRPGNVELKRGKTYHLMMTIDKKGKGSVYVDYKKIGSFSNSQLANQPLYLRVEGSARLNGDGVKATFQNVKLKNGGKYFPEKAWGTHEFKTNPGINQKIKSDGTIIISGKVTGLGAGEDWDNRYNDVSNIVQFVE